MAVKRRGLGKGLSALIPDEPSRNNDEGKDSKGIIYIDINSIEPNEEQPRRQFNQESLLELSTSIKNHGIIQPIIVRRSEKGYQLIAGERRWRAAKIAGFKEIPCIVKDLKQLQSTKLALIENLQREDLNPIEEALAYKGLIDNHGLTQEEVSDVIGKSRSYIANVTRLLNLDKRVIELISRGELSSGHGRTLLGLENRKLQFEIAKVIVEKSLSVRETERLVKEMTKENKNRKEKKKKKDPSLIEIEETLRKALGTKVQISSGRKKGKIEIEYYSLEDLERIIEVITRY